MCFLGSFEAFFNFKLVFFEAVEPGAHLGDFVFHCVNVAQGNFIAFDASFLGTLACVDSLNVRFDARHVTFRVGYHCTLVDRSTLEVLCPSGKFTQFGVRRVCVTLVSHLHDGAIQ